MNHISNLLPSLEKNQVVSQSLQKPYKVFSKEEAIAIEKKYAEPTIGQMNQPQVFTKAAEAVQRIHVITGWNVPDDKTYTKILIEELSLKLIEDFPNLNFTEVVYAFRKNGIGIKDWGKHMNLELICQVLAQYSEERKRISAEEERNATKPVQRIYSEEEIRNEYRFGVEAFYQRCINGVRPPDELPDYFKEILVHDGLIHPDSNDLHAFFADWLNNGHSNIYVKE